VVPYVLKPELSFVLHHMMTCAAGCQSSRIAVVQLPICVSCSGLQVLEDVTEYETSADGVTETQLEQILLNGNNIALLVPGGKPE